MRSDSCHTDPDDRQVCWLFTLALESHWLSLLYRIHCVRSSLSQPDLNLSSARLSSKATSARPCAPITRSNQPNISRLHMVPHRHGTSFVRWMRLLSPSAGILPWRLLNFASHPVYLTFGITVQSQGSAFTRVQRPPAVGIRSAAPRSTAHPSTSNTLLNPSYKAIMGQQYTPLGAIRIP